MKNLLFILAFAAVSCTVEPVGNNNQDQYYIEPQCGIIIATGEDQRGDYICVRMEYHNPSQYNRYKVSDYKVFQLNTEICNFDGLTNEAN